MKHLFKLMMCAFAALLFACSPQKKEEGSKSDAFDKAEDEVRQKIESVIAEIPSPSEIPFLLESTGVEFNASFTHDIDASGNYLNNNNKAAVNLGVYATDVAYLASYNQTQDAMKYTANLKELGEQLGLTSAFSPATIKRFEANVSNKDSLASIVNEAIKKADQHLKDTDRPKAAALVIGGSFIEGLYISCALVRNYPEDILPQDARMLVLVPLIDVILKQEEPLADLIELMESLEKDKWVGELLSMMKELKASYARLNIKELIEQGKGQELLKDDTLDEITNKAGKIRDYITS